MNQIGDRLFSTPDAMCQRTGISEVLCKEHESDCVPVQSPSSCPHTSAGSLHREQRCQQVGDARPPPPLTPQKTKENPSQCQSVSQ